MSALLPFLLIFEIYLITQGHIWRDKALWRERNWTFPYQITSLSRNEFFITPKLHGIILKWHDMSYFSSNIPGIRLEYKRKLMVLRIGCSKGFTLSLLTLDNWQSTAGEAGRNMPVAFRDGSYGLFFMVLHKKLWQIITAVTDALNLPKVCLC